MEDDVYVGTISFEFVSSDPESAGRELDEHARRVRDGLSVRRVEVNGPVRVLQPHGEETEVGT